MILNIIKNQQEERGDKVKTYTFNWQCDEAWGELELEFSEEVELIKSI